MRRGSQGLDTRPVRLTMVLLLLVVAVAGIGAQEAKTAFIWAFVKRAADGTPAPIDFKERVAIVPGDLFKILMQPVRRAFIYLFLHDADGDLQQLFPKSFSQFESPGYSNTRFFLPEGDNWFTLDSARGTERFYLIVSAERLRTLESRAAAHEASTGAARNTTRQAVLDEIARVRSQHSMLTVAAEKPVTIAGGTRGINAAVEKVATWIGAAGFYYKLFRLEH